MRKHYEYETDKEFIKTIDELRVKDILVKITVLNFTTERPIQEIQGRVISGDLSIQTSSPIRRSGSLTVYVDETNDDILNIDNIISINKKVMIELGIKNTTNQYTQYDYIWFKQGIFILTGVSITHDENGVTFSVNISDKMCLLDGSISGKFTSSTILNKVDQYIPALGEYYSQYLLIENIIMEVVHHLGGEQLGNIIISDLEPTVTYAASLGNYVENPIYTKCKNIINEYIEINKKEVDKANANKSKDAVDRQKYITEEDIYTQYIDFQKYVNNQGYTNDSSKGQITENQLIEAFLILHKADILENTDFQSIGIALSSMKLELKENMSKAEKADYINKIFTYQLKLCDNDAISKALDESMTKNLTINFNLYYDLYYKQHDKTQGYGNFLNIHMQEYLDNIYLIGQEPQGSSKLPTYKLLSDEPIGYSHSFAPETTNTSTSYTYNQNEMIGYTVTDFTYPGDLTASIGSTITSILTNIVQKLGGNYEYFYDVDGRFHFQEIKNYLNTTYTSTILSNTNSTKKLYDKLRNSPATKEEFQGQNMLAQWEIMTKEEKEKWAEDNTINLSTPTSEISYQLNRELGKSVYNFDNSDMIVSYNNNLQYETIKNDFVLWGKQSNGNNDSLAIRYHLAIDKKPKAGNTYNMVIYYPFTELSDGSLVFEDRPRAARPYYFDDLSATETYYKESYDTNGKLIYEAITVNVPKLNYKEDAGLFYVQRDAKPLVAGTITQNEDGSYITGDEVWIWESEPPTNLDGSISRPHWIKFNEAYNQGLNQLDSHPYLYVQITTQDWRNELYLQGIQDALLYSTPNDYYAELLDQWPLIYNVCEAPIDACGRIKGMSNYMQDYEVCVPLVANNNMGSVIKSESYDDLLGADILKLDKNLNSFTLVPDDDTNEDTNGYLTKIKYGYNQFIFNSYDTVINKLNNVDIVKSLFEDFNKYSTYLHLYDSNAYEQFQVDRTKKYDYSDTQTSYTFDKTVNIISILQSDFIKAVSLDAINQIAEQLDDHDWWNLLYHGWINMGYQYTLLADLRSLIIRLTDIIDYAGDYIESDTKFFNDTCKDLFNSLLGIYIICKIQNRICYKYDETIYKNDIYFKDNDNKAYTTLSVKDERTCYGFKENPSSYPYYLDFIDSSAKIGEFSIQNIGRRTDSINNDSLNCMIDQNVPNIYLLEDPEQIDMDYHMGENEQDIQNEIKNKMEELINNLKPYALVPTALLEALTQDVYQGLYEAARELLYQETSYSEQITINCMPIYHLDVNTRITVKDPKSGIFGDYLITSISLPLDIEGTMSMQCTKIHDRV